MKSCKCVQPHTTIVEWWHQSCTVRFPCGLRLYIPSANANACPSSRGRCAVHSASHALASAVPGNPGWRLQHLSSGARGMLAASHLVSCFCRYSCPSVLLSLAHVRGCACVGRTPDEVLFTYARPHARGRYHVYNRTPDYLNEQAHRRFWAPAASVTPPGPGYYKNWPIHSIYLIL